MVVVVGGGGGGGVGTREDCSEVSSALSDAPSVDIKTARRLYFDWYETCRQGELAERKPGASKSPDYNVENGEWEYVGGGGGGEADIYFPASVRGWRGDVALGGGADRVCWLVVVGGENAAVATYRGRERMSCQKEGRERRRNEIMYERPRTAKEWEIWKRKKKVEGIKTTCM